MAAKRKMAKERGPGSGEYSENFNASGYIGQDDPSSTFSLPYWPAKRLIRVMMIQI